VQTQEITYRAKLVTKITDGLGYTSYVFENLEHTDEDYKYFMCVRFPNWNQGSINLEDIGYVTVKYVKGGIDKWFDGNEMMTYKYTNIIFLKFIPEKEKVELNLIKVD
jgi:hypothetical protein